MAVLSAKATTKLHELHKFDIFWSMLYKLWKLLVLHRSGSLHQEPATLAGTHSSSVLRAAQCVKVNMTQKDSKSISNQVTQVTSSDSKLWNTDTRKSLRNWHLWGEADAKCSRLGRNAGHMPSSSRFKFARSAQRCRCGGVVRLQIQEKNAWKL